MFYINKLLYIDEECVEYIDFIVGYIAVKWE